MKNRSLGIKGMLLLGQIVLGVFAWIPAAALTASEANFSWNLAKVSLFSWQLLCIPVLSLTSVTPGRYAPVMKAFYLLTTFLALSVLLIPLGFGLILLFCLFGFCHVISLPFTLFCGFDFLRELLVRRAVPGAALTARR